MPSYPHALLLCCQQARWVLIAVVFWATLFCHGRAQCQRHLPVAEQARVKHGDNVKSATRILAGLPASPADEANIVTIAFDVTLTTRDYRCAGSLIAANWVLTAAQCFVRPGRDYVLHGGGHSLAGPPRRIDRMIPHPGWDKPSTNDDDSIPTTRDDLMLVHLEQPINSTAPSDGFTSPNFMRLNTNKDFAVPPAPPRFLRFKGYGLTEPPLNNDEPLQAPRSLTYGDMRTAACNDTYGSDGNRRLCTAFEDGCGPCFGDIGGPLYEVDASGTVNVLVAVLSLSAIAAANTSACASSDSPIVYTAVAPYIPWIRDTIMDDTALQLEDLPAAGLTDDDLAPPPAPFPTAARISIIVVSALILAAGTVALIFFIVVRVIYRRRRRWKEGLHAEDSFVEPGAKHAAVDDPFEGIADRPRPPRHSLRLDNNNLSPGPAGNRDSRFSAILCNLTGVSHATISSTASPTEKQFGDNAPSWLNSAWERLFGSSSRSGSNLALDAVAVNHTAPLNESSSEVSIRVVREDAEIGGAIRKLPVSPPVLQAIDDASSSYDESSSGGDTSIAQQRHADRPQRRPADKPKDKPSDLVDDATAYVNDKVTSPSRRDRYLIDKSEKLPNKLLAPIHSLDDRLENNDDIQEISTYRKNSGAVDIRPFSHNTFPQGGNSFARPFVQREGESSKFPSVVSTSEPSYRRHGHVPRDSTKSMQLDSGDGSHNTGYNDWRKSRANVSATEIATERDTGPVSMVSFEKADFPSGAHFKSQAVQEDGMEDPTADRSTRALSYDKSATHPSPKHSESTFPSNVRQHPNERVKAVSHEAYFPETVLFEGSGIINANPGFSSDRRGERQTAITWTGPKSSTARVSFEKTEEFGETNHRTLTMLSNRDASVSTALHQPRRTATKHVANTNALSMQSRNFDIMGGDAIGSPIAYDKRSKHTSTTNTSEEKHLKLPSNTDGGANEKAWHVNNTDAVDDNEGEPVSAISFEKESGHGGSEDIRGAAAAYVNGHRQQMQRRRVNNGNADGLGSLTVVPEGMHSEEYDCPPALPRSPYSRY